MPSTVHLKPRENPRLTSTFVVRGGGVDLVATPSALVRSHRDSATGKVDRADLAASSWSALTIATGLPTDAVVTLAYDAARGYVLALYHDGSGATQILLSEDDGVSFAARADLAGLKFPRAVCVPGFQLLAAHDGTHLQVYRSRDWFASALGSPVQTFTLSAQPVALRQDRRGRIHLVAGGSSVVGYSTFDGLTWAGPVTLAASRDLGAADYEVPAGVVLQWDSATLHAQGTDAGYDNPAGSEAAPSLSPALPKQWLGAVFDRFGFGWLVGQMGDNSMRTFYTRDRGAAFTEVT